MIEADRPKKDSDLTARRRDLPLRKMRTCDNVQRICSSLINFSRYFSCNPSALAAATRLPWD
jgi:hypothetical protein